MLGLLNEYGFTRILLLCVDQMSNPYIVEKVLILLNYTKCCTEVKINIFRDMKVKGYTSITNCFNIMTLIAAYIWKYGTM